MKSNEPEDMEIQRGETMFTDGTSKKTLAMQRERYIRKAVEKMQASESFVVFAAMPETPEGRPVSWVGLAQGGKLRELQSMAYLMKLAGLGQQTIAMTMARLVREKAQGLIDRGKA